MEKPLYWEQACAELSARDSVLAQLINTYPGLYLVNHGCPLTTLARSIVGQQISVKAAQSVWTKLEACLEQIDAARIVQCSPESLRACGLSERKVGYLQDLARFALDGRLLPARWQQQSEEDIIGELITIRGIGRWTAEMFLMFYLQRPDVYPVDDIGIQKAIGLHYYDNIRPNLTQLREIGKQWQPWRTIACWYLWRSLEPLPVSY